MPVKPWPSTVSRAPPAASPVDADTELTEGGLTKVNRSALRRTDVPALVWSLTSTAPAACAGEVTWSLVDETRWTDEPRVFPNDTVIPRAKWLPVIVTRWPPAVLPEVGATPGTRGTELVAAAGPAARAPAAPAPTTSAPTRAATVRRMAIPSVLPRA